jgi:hypothetical protein
MSEYYALNDDHTVRPISDTLEWARAFEDRDKRRVARDQIGEVTISTVFLGLDHSWGGGPPLIFETMIFGGEHSDDQWRYSTWYEAVEGHRRAVALVRGDND